jgi:hypothetical protein
MNRWRIPILLDDHPHELIVAAHSARAALAQLARHRANGGRNPGLRVCYAIGGGGQMDIRWGQVDQVAVGPVTEIGPGLTGSLTPAA